MPRPITLLTVCALVLYTLTSAAPINVDNQTSLEKRGGSHIKKSASKSSSSGSKYSGTATWFTPATEGGSTGACGDKEGNNSLIVALNAKQYGSLNSVSSWCGKKITITGPSGTATATVNDACPNCKYGDLDLTPALFKKVVGDMNTGVGDITWKLLED